MNFLIDAHHIGGRQTGNETWIRNILRELAKDSVDMLTVATFESGLDEIETLTGHRPLVVAPTAVRRLVWDLPRIARRNGVDSMLLQYSAPVSRRPCVVMVHDLSVFDREAAQWVPHVFRLRVQQSIRDAARRAAVLLTPSQFTKSQIVDICGVDPERIRISCNAVDPELAALIDASSRAPTDNGTRTVLAVGNILPRKNLEVAAAAIAKLRTDGLNVRLRVVGSARRDGQPILVRMTGLLGDALSVTGYITQEQLAQEYANADVFVFPSVFEGFGIPAIEAMYAGLPLVVSDRGSLPEIASSCAEVAGAHDAGAWSQAIGRALEGLGSAEVERRAHASSYSWAASAATVLTALRSAGGT